MKIPLKRTLRSHLLATALCSLCLKPAFSQPIANDAPDWSRIHFSTLPPIQASGAYIADLKVIDLLGYDPSRHWYRGQEIAQFMQLGDFQHLGLERWTLKDLQQHSAINLNQLRLSDVGLLRWQSLGDVARAIPALAHYPIATVRPIADVLRAYNISFTSENKIADLLQDPARAALPLAAVDLNRYSLQSMPALETAPLGEFHRWQQSTIAQVPGLSRALPIAQPGTSMAIARVDIAFGATENDRWRTVSGSFQEGFQVPCLWRCPHLELGDCLLNCFQFQFDPLEGKQWISGKYQQVRGGEGILAAVNGGKEPTGRHPFGADFKVVIWETDEASGTAERALFFRICLDGLGCTPYFIGPVPWVPVREEGLIEL